MTQRQQVWKEEGGVVSDGRQAQTRWIACRASLATGAGERQKAGNSERGAKCAMQRKPAWTALERKGVINEYLPKMQ
jgi:hypothetical protein